MIGNNQLPVNYLRRSRIALCVVGVLTRVESVIGDVHVDMDVYRIFSTPLSLLRLNQFQNNDHCENWTRFSTNELIDLVPRLGLPEYVYVFNTPGNFYRFHREELLIYTLTKLAHGFPHTVMSDMVVGGDSARWGRGYNYMMQHLDDHFSNIINVDSLGMWVHQFPYFSELIRRKHCSCWNQHDDVDGNPVIDAENIYQNEGSFNISGLMDVSVFEITRVGSGPVGEGTHQPRRPNWYIKQRSVCSAHKKFHGLSMLTVSFPNGMIAVVGVASSRNWDGTTLTWSQLDNFLNALCANNNIGNYCFYADNGFLGGWTNIRTPHRGTLMFPLTARLRKENVVMTKIRIRVEWAHGIVKSYWKLATKYLFLKLDQNADLVIQTLRVSCLVSNFRTCYRGNSLSNVVSFDCAPPSIEECLNSNNV